MLKCILKERLSMSEDKADFFFSNKKEKVFEKQVVLKIASELQS